MLGVKTGMQLSQSTLESLKGIRKMELDLDPSETRHMITVPVGNSLIEANKDKATLDDARERSEKDFYQSLATELIHHPELVDAMGTYDSSIIVGDELHEVTFETLISRFFMMKRYDERFNNLEVELRNMGNVETLQNILLLHNLAALKHRGMDV